MKNKYLPTTTLLFYGLTVCLFAQEAKIQKFPADNAKDVNPDTHLVLTFPVAPILGTTGKIRIYDAKTDVLVDELDISIPAGPTEPNTVRAPYIKEPYKYTSTNYTNANTKPGTPSGGAEPTSDKYQLNIVGRFTDGFHFYPVIIHGKVATIYPHNNMLQYGKTYYVQIDAQVFGVMGNNFSGITGKKGWVFSTKKEAPEPTLTTLLVAADDSGDFNTVQGAMDFIPDFNEKAIQVNIKNGTYEEIVYFRNKAHVIIKGERRDSVVVCYPNNEVFNPHPVNIATNEHPGTFPSRRAAFMMDNCKGITLNNLTIKSVNEKPAQAEALLINGEENAILNVTIDGSGDALQVNGSAYFKNTRIIGVGDNILGRGPSFFQDCELISTGGPHMWIRNTEKNHGNVFVNCAFSTVGDGETVLARSPINHGQGYPYAEAVLIDCKLEDVAPAGFDPVEGDTTNVHFWEYNSTDLETGKPVDYSQRNKATKQLKLPEDKEAIEFYSNPANIVGYWVNFYKIKE